jgi:predicted esterase YcpF (UPF0227 family)
MGGAAYDPAMPSTTHLLYLHGFRSSPKSTKAVMVAQRLAQAHPGVTWWCPQLPPSPKAAMELVLSGTAGWPAERMAVIGSSLGGFYATVVHNERGCRAVMLNPAVHPARDLAKYIGEQVAWHDPNERFFFEPRYVDELREMDRPGLRDPGKVYALVAKGDEVLDWREMVARFPGAKVKLLEGSDHAISDFAQHMDEVLGFALGS